VRTNLHFARPFFATSNQRINVLVGVRAALPTQDLVRPEPHHLHEFSFLERCVLFSQPALLNDSCVKEELSIRTFDDLLFDGPLSYKAEDLDGLFLSNSVSTTAEIKG
jgi:hypothetical protein